MANMPPALGEAAGIYYARQVSTANETRELIQSVWNGMEGKNFQEKWEWFNAVARPAMLRIILNGEARSLLTTEEYLRVVSLVQGMEMPQVATAAFVTPEDTLDAVLGSQMNNFVVETIQGKPENLAKISAGVKFLQTANSALMDVGRDATSAAMITSDDVYGYVRVLQHPSCKRCAVMAGREYKKNTQFQRHTNCDCQTLPIAEAYDDATTDPVQAIKDGNVTGLSKADTEAITEHGADVSQVINASQGTYKTNLLGEPVKATYTGTSSRAVAGRRLGDLEKQPGRRYRQTKNTRLTPSQILKLAEGNPERAREMLWNHGFVY